jgi:hypothetical protein
VLPGLETVEAFSLAIGLYLIPVGALMAQPWQTVMFTAMVINFVPLLGERRAVARWGFCRRELLMR